MQENELPKNMGKKIVDALKQQDEQDLASVETETENEITDFNEDISAVEDVDLEETVEKAAEFDFGADAKDYQPVFAVDEQDTATDSDMKISIENEEDVEEFEMPNNINVLKRLISQLPTGVPRQTGAQIIRQTIEALGIPMKTVLQDAQRVRDCLNSSIKDCNYTVQEYKSNIRTLEKQSASYQKQLNKLNDIIGLFVYSDKK